MTTVDVVACLERLAAAERNALRDVAQAGTPRTPGIYALWHIDELLYVGIARQDPALTTNVQAAGLAGRLNTYRRARLTSDFTIAVAFRFVVPTLSSDQRLQLASGDLSVRDMQALVKEWTAAHVDFSTDSVAPDVATAAEAHARRHGLPAVAPPTFNRLD